MNNKTIRSNILHTISSRINPYSNNIQYEHASCSTCIKKSTAQPQSSKKKRNQPHLIQKNMTTSQIIGNNLSIKSRIYDLKIEGVLNEKIGEFWERDDQMMSHHYREDVKSEQVSVDTKDKFVCIEEYMREIRDSIQNWVDIMINYMHLQEESIKEKVLPFEQKLDLRSYKFQCFDRIDIIANLLKQPKAASSSKLIDTKKTINSSTIIQNPEKNQKSSIQLEEQYTRMLFLQALSLQKHLLHKPSITLYKS